jgi:hypothetical protein
MDVVAFDGATPAQPRMRDEIKIYQNDRYVLAFEASHRLYGFDLHKEHPNVIRLAVHLKGSKTILFKEGTDIAVVLNRNPHTTMTAWFAFNKTAREHLNRSAPLRLALNTFYHDFPRIATWKKEGKAMDTPHINASSVACRSHVLCATLRRGEVLLASFVASRAWGYVF